MATQVEIELSNLRTMESVKSSDFAAAFPVASAPWTLHDSREVVTEEPSQLLPKGRSTIVITQLSGITFMTSFSTGMITVALPTMAVDLDIAPGLTVWPTAALALTCGTCMLIAGSVSDAIGPRSVNLTGTLLVACFILACGLSRTGVELIVFRAMQGVASAMVTPSAMSIVSTSVETGRPRNIGFATLGLCQPLGFALGLVLAGVFVSGVGWRVGFYVGSAVSFLLFVIGIWALPATSTLHEGPSVVKRLALDIDWVGAAVGSVALALFSYVLAMLSVDVDNIKHAANIALLTISVLLVPVFIWWMHRQEQQSKPALIPNRLWKTGSFTSVCIMLVLSSAVMNSMELYSSLFFQEVQHVSALGASIRLLPNLLLGVCIELTMGLLVDRVPATWLVLASSVLCAGSPLLMANIRPQWPYWYDAFFAQLLAPMSGDVLFTIGLLIVADLFPARTQALAGAVFNTVWQLGSSIGLSTMSIISAARTDESRVADKSSAQALMEGYRASFWAMFAFAGTICLFGAVGMRKVGKVGMKRE